MNWMKRILCKTGLHKWGGWHTTTGHIDPDGRHTFTVRQRECERCGFKSMKARLRIDDEIDLNLPEWWR